MSIDAAHARVAELQSLIAAASGSPLATPAATAPAATQPAQSFDSVLAQTQTPAAAGATDGSSATGNTGGVTASGANTPYAAEIDAAASKYGLDPALLRGLIRQESNFNPKAGSPAGAQGLCQLMPGTARALGCTNPWDPAQNIDAGARYLKQQLDRFGGDVPKALAAYNAGPGAVQRYGGVPPYAETQNYVRRVQAYADEYRRQAEPVSASTAAADAAARLQIQTP